MSGSATNQRTQSFFSGLSALGIAAVLACAGPETARAGTGYAVGHESVTGAGVAYAGGAAAALDASTIHYNPAGMSLLEHDELIVGAQLVVPNIHFTDQGSTIFDGSRLTGSTGGNGGEAALVPTIYWAKRLNDRVHVGVGLTAPYGLVTKYDAAWVGRYNEVTTSLKVMNVNPSVSYKVNDVLSVGAGFDVQYAIAKLGQAIDFGTVCASALGSGTCAAGFGLSPQASDGYGMVKGHDFGFGFNLGVLVQPTPGLRFGAHYRSHVKLKFNGDGIFAVPANARAFLAAAGMPTAFTNTDATFALTIPEQASVSAYAKVDPRLAVMADLTWTRWSRFKDFRAVFADPATPPNVLQTQWKNVWRVAVGAAFDYSDAWTFRAGVAFDQSPVSDTFRDPGIPDSDRWVAAVGFSTKLKENLTLDASYQHLFFDKGSTRRSSATGSLLVGAFDVNVHVAGLALRWTL